MNIVESFQDLFQNLSRNLFRKSVLIKNFIKEFLALEILSDNIPFLLSFKILIDIEDVRMVQIL